MHIIAWRVLFIVLAYAVSGQGWLQGFVLCFEPNGRFHVEPAHTGECILTTQFSFHGEQGSLSPLTAQESRHCGPCRDVPFLTMSPDENFSLRTACQNKSFDAAVFSFPLLSFALLERKPERSYVLQNALASSSRTSFLRTVVLLT